MICKNCRSELTDNETFCKVCGRTVGKEKKTFRLEIPEEKLDYSESVSSLEKSEEAVPKKEETVENFEAADEIKAVKAYEEAVKESLAQPETHKKEELAEETEETKADKAEEILNEFAKIQDEMAAKKASEIESKPVNDTEYRKNIASVKAKERKAQAAAQKGAKKVKNANTLMRVFTCLCAVMVVMLTFVSAFTGVFDESGAEKTVALSSLSEQDAQSFEEMIVKYQALFEADYDSEKSVSDDVLSFMKPDSENGLYAGVIGKAKTETVEADPASRFEVGEEAKGYCTVSSKKVSKILSSLSLTSLNDANCKDYYYYDGNYYFASSSDESRSDEVSAEVVSSKKTSDGNYYIVCDIYPLSSKTSDGTYTTEPSAQKYFLVTLDSSGEEKTWKILKISSSPLYEETGSKITSEDGENSLAFVIKRKTVTAKTEDGTVYAKYIVQYPYFETDGATQLAVNTIYSEKISAFKKLAKNADKLYESYIENGGDKDALPLYTHVLASVKYNENGYFSLLERTTEYDPLSQASQEGTTGSVSQTAVSDETQITFPKTTYESYTFEISGGEFVKKDELAGKDYLAVQETLYKKWLGIDESATEEYVPTDSNGVGAAIYASTWVLTKDGITFCYQPQNSMLDEVSVPYSELTERSILK